MHVPSVSRFLSCGVMEILSHLGVVLCERRCTRGPSKVRPLVPQMLRPHFLSLDALIAPLRGSTERVTASGSRWGDDMA
ncbi:hypothetical protein OH77DRAFT_1426738 [Trametes cingulata]|nr:hypothetical protein OH77DRAFT_1426738 [Trametes cingulata]